MRGEIKNYVTSEIIDYFLTCVPNPEIELLRLRLNFLNKKLLMTQ